MKNHSLYVRLLYLYKKISIALVRIRMRSYRPFNDSNDTFDITSLLRQQINTLAPDLNDSNEPLTNSKGVAKYTGIHATKVDVKNNQDNGLNNISSTESEFAKYLNQKTSSSIDHPYMGDKLKKSAWEHIHCTIRYARQGNVAMAKLHADIAGHALEEAVHFIKDEEYSELILEIEECFEKSKIK